MKNKGKELEFNRKKQSSKCTFSIFIQHDTTSWFAIAIFSLFLSLYSRYCCTRNDEMVVNQNYTQWKLSIFIFPPPFSLSFLFLFWMLRIILFFLSLLPCNKKRNLLRKYEKKKRIKRKGKNCIFEGKVPFFSLRCNNNKFCTIISITTLNHTQTHSFFRVWLFLFLKRIFLYDCGQQYEY